jgi:hypothetical protein
MCLRAERIGAHGPGEFGTPAAALATTGAGPGAARDAQCTRPARGHDDTDGGMAVGRRRIG